MNATTNYADLNVRKVGGLVSQALNTDQARASFLVPDMKLPGALEGV